MATITNVNQLLEYVQSYIMCAICEKPVDLVSREQSFEMDAYRFKVWCHGDTDHCIIPRQFIENMIGKKLEPGYAFTITRLEGQDSAGTIRSVDSVAQADRGRELPRHVQLSDRSALAPGGQENRLLSVDEVRDAD